MVQSGVVIPSDFTFNEAIAGDQYKFYPPTPPLLMPLIYGSRMKCEHVDDVNWMLHNLLEAILENYAAPPKSTDLHLLRVLIEGVRGMNPNGSLATFTTNYDSSLEEAFDPSVCTGMVGGTWKPTEGFALGQDDMSIFRLPGSRGWVIKVDIPELFTSSDLKIAPPLDVVPSDRVHLVRGGLCMESIKTFLRVYEGLIMGS